MQRHYFEFYVLRQLPILTGTDNRDLVGIARVLSPPQLGNTEVRPVKNSFARQCCTLI
jgi:hypothetical protein